MDIQELWDKIQGEFTKVNTRLDNVETKVGSMDTRLGNVETKVESMDTRLSKVETEVKEVKYENKGIKEEINKINQRLDVIQNVNLVNILQKQDQILKELNSAITMNNLEHENFRYRHERVEKALGIA